MLNKQELSRSLLIDKIEKMYPTNAIIPAEQSKMKRGLE